MAKKSKLQEAIDAMEPFDYVVIIGLVALFLLGTFSARTLVILLVVWGIWKIVGRATKKQIRAQSRKARRK